MPDVDVAALRPLMVLIPVALAGVLWLLVDDPRRRGAAGLALLWNLIGLTAINAVAVAVGWWRFDAVPDAGIPAIGGVPVDLFIAWAVAWSVIPVLAARWIPLPYAVTALVLADIYGMTELAPVVELRGDWWWGELLAVTTCLIPGIVLAGLTTAQRWLRVRVALQVVLFTAVLFVAIPVLAHRAALSAGLQPSAVHVGGAVDSVVIQIGGVIALIALAAVIEFARAGGTPWPWDPPTRLVTTGPYAYVANPMQLCGTVLIAATAVVTAQPILLVAGIVAASFSAGLAAWVEDDALARRHGERWRSYRSRVRAWLPRWRPVPDVGPATAYLARGCDPCSELAGWIADRSPVALELRDAEDHPEPLERMRYEGNRAVTLNGVRALAAVLVHLNLGWATVGWVIGAPVISSVLQVLVDACGGAPREVR